MRSLRSDRSAILGGTPASLRRRPPSFRPALALVAFTFAFAGPALAESAAGSIPDGGDLAAAARAILEANCAKCHGPREAKGGLRLDVREAALAGGDSGRAALVPGDAASSLLLELVRGENPDFPPMPPKSDPLPEADVETLRAWIDAGAAWPEGAGALDPASHWAYVPPRATRPPTVSDPAWAEHPVDAFVKARLEREGIEPSPPADPLVLARRVALDLTGVPPSPEEADALAAAMASGEDPRAYEKYVDRLLATTAYAERWASHWLDLARYADSNGFEKDLAREIWPWRDWVIRALDRDLPFDQFVVEQLAGDMLPGATLEQVVATGFHRNSMINEEGGVDPEDAHVKAIHDRVDTTATVFLATTMACAQCHDHKYDPFSQKEYYRFFAIFNRQISDVKIADKFHQRNGGERVRVPTPEQRRLIDAIEAEKRALELRLESNPAEREASLARLWELSAIGPRDVPTTMVMGEQEHPRESFVLAGGSYTAPGEPVEPGLPGVWPGPPEGRSIDRLTFARWLTAPGNPLTARVFVNRVWEQYFGTGIVKTTEDFGTQGERPSHPELLDWLALDFEWNGWSMKSLHRRIVTSRAYRQSSAIRPDLLERDPYNRLIARGPRVRLPAETIRDQALRAAGLLALDRVGGPSVFPHQPEGVWKMPYSSAKWTLSEGPDRFRRGLYTWVQRTAPHPASLAFDMPTREAPCTRRIRTNTPLQALVALNDPAMMEAARGLARRTGALAGDDAARVERMFRLCLLRTPRAEESERLRAFLEARREDFRADPEGAKAVVTEGCAHPPPEGSDLAELAAWTMLGNVLLNLDETLVKG